jgi:hypothetical protein
MSRQKISLLALAIAATGAITAHRFLLPAGTVSAAAGDAIGVAAHDGVSGDLINTDVIGTTIIETGGTFGVGALLQSDATGRAILATATRTKTATVAGGAAGDITVTGIGATDRIVSVTVLDRDATAANINLATLTSEFTVTAANTINNAGGTATTGNALLVVWEAANPVKAKALQASTGAGQFVEALLMPAN